MGGTTALKSEENPLAGIGDLSSLLQLFTGSKTTTSQSGAAMQALLGNILSGTQGLAAVSSGAKSAGGYNSSAQSLLTNDFLTRAAAQASAGTTTKSVAPAVGTGTATGALALMAGKSLLGPTVKAGAKKLGLNTDDLGKQLSESIFGPSATPMDSLGAAQESFRALEYGSDYFGIGADIGSSALDLGGIVSGGIGDAALETASYMGAGADAFDAGTAIAEGVDAASFGVPWFTLINLATDGAAGSAIADAGSNIEDLAHNFFGGLFS